MSLKDFKIASDVVTFRGGSLELRGLSLNDFSVLMRGYMAELNNLFKLYEDDASRDLAITQSVKFATTIVQEAPGMVAQMIVLCGDEDQSLLPTAAKLPLPVQVECVRKIIELTFEEAGGAKKFLDSLVGMVKVMGPSGATPTPD
jgi:hypothetical protein